MTNHSPSARHARPSRSFLRPRRVRSTALTTALALVALGALPALARFIPEADPTSTVAESSPARRTS